MAQYTTKKNESLSKIRTALYGRDEERVDLTAATNVFFFSRKEGETTNDIDGLACTIEAPAIDGEITLPPVPHDSVGRYKGWFKVVWGAGEPDYIPSAGYYTGQVEESWEA